MTNPTETPDPFDEFLACAECGSGNLQKGDNTYKCSSCGTEYGVIDGVASFFRKNALVMEEERDRMEFWNQGWDEAGSPFGTVERENPMKLREEFRTMLVAQKYPAVTWFSEDTIRDAVFLNVGCGGGYEGVLFAGYGTRYIGVDFSINAAVSTRNLIKSAGYIGTCYHCEAERLPLKDSTIDVVYTNGVLHHTPKTLDTLKELHRVMAPGARAVIALYATHSVAFYWYRFRAILAGNFSKHSIELWVDRNTEGEWQTGDRKNKHTRTYTRTAFRALLEEGGFKVVRLEQSQLQLRDIPVFGRILSLFLSQNILRKCIGPFGMMLIGDCKARKH